MTTTPKGTRGAAYIRISDDKQDMESQRISIKKWLTRNNLRCDRWYEDVGSRHESYRRPEFQRLLAAVSGGEIDWIIVESKDRFGVKNSYEFGKFASELMDNDVELWSVNAGHLTGDDYATEILTTVDSVRSRDEQLERSRRAVRGMAAAIEQGAAIGGLPPYGYDFVCLGTDGTERWRVKYEGHNKRVKILPNGEQERYDGRSNFPGRDKSDRLEIAPTVDQKRIETVQKIFHWFATESITYAGIARRLNDLGVDPVYCERWYGIRVNRVLHNPAVLVGKVVGNKAGHGSFFSMKAGGKLEAVPTRRGRAKSHRPHEEADFVYPKEWGEGIVDRDTWDLVQAKLKGIHKSKRAPRSPEMWLTQFMYCGQCGHRMTGWKQTTYREPYGYVCSMYRRFGENNKYGCKLHRISHNQAVTLVERFLKEAGQKLDEVLTAPPSLDWEAVEGKDRATREYTRMITAIWATIKKWRVRNPTGRPWAGNTLADAFRLHAPKYQATQRAELKKAKEEYKEATEKYLELPERAREIVRAKLEAMEQKIAALEQALRPMDEQLAELKDELERAKDRVDAAQKACQGSGNRQKAEALSRVVARIVCYYESYRHTRKDKQVVTKARLQSVTFEPLVGEPITLKAGEDDETLRNETAASRRSGRPTRCGRTSGR